VNVKCPANWVVFVAFLGFISFARAAEYVRVAYDDAGAAEKQPHLTAGSDWRFVNPGAATESERTAAFGECVEFRYAGLNPKAAYKVKLRFFSDGPREERIWLGRKVAVESAVLESGKETEREIEIPPEAYTSGKLTLSIEKIGGPNVVVSEIEVFSTDPAALGAIPLPEPELPLLTPRPITAPFELGGAWKFSPSAPVGFEKAAAHDDWAGIQVPSEWVMQGFKVVPNTPAAYFRTFEFSSKPAGQRFKLRFSAVYSLCRVWLNGIEVGGHEGGFVPFEFDVTDALKPGANTLAVSVQSESPMDKLSCGSQYASHPLGGITRKVQLFSVPEVHVSDLKIETTFDKTYHNATLTARLAIRNQSDHVSSGSTTLAVVPVANSNKADVAPVAVKWGGLAPGETRIETATLSVNNPAKWDNEHPHLYKLVITAKDAAGSQGVVEEKFGFRQIEVHGNQVLVNGTPIKIHGVCRHEVHPLLGRALNSELWKKDAEIFREGNCNFIRTSHYPPAEEFIDECDRLGLFVELESPLCWVGHGASDNFKGIPSGEPIFERLARANLETVQGYPNHPSVIMRSMANESSWSTLFARVHKAIRKADPTRPCTFHDQCWDNFNNGGSKEMPIAVIHYPGLEGPARCIEESRPVHFGEYCHLESYNRRELATDPGLRDLWGQGLDLMWGKMRTATGCFGGSIWAAIDDTFFLPSGETVGYGTWGPIDGWRRTKPEFWHMKKAYSPLRISATSVPVPAAGKPVRLEVENRHDFTDLSELRFDWKIGEHSGAVAASAQPGSIGILEIPVGEGDFAGKLLEIRALSPRGFVEDVWQVALGDDPRIAPPVFPKKPGVVKLKKVSGSFVVHGVEYTVNVDQKTGMMKAIGKNGKSSILTGPELMLLPANDDSCGGNQMLGMEQEVALSIDACHDWKATAVTAQETGTGVEIRIEGSYTEAKGFYNLSFSDDGMLSVHYAFVVTEQGKCNPRQIGVVFGLPAECQTISWRRKAFWSSYPDDHIGRPKGAAAAFEKGLSHSGLAGPRVEPNWSWSRDVGKYGSNDFRSTKMNVIEAALLSSAGNGVRMLSDGSQHVRCWVDGECVRILAANYANEGAPPFFSEHVMPHHPLHAGSPVESTVQMEIR
jgi:beta-galactosidase